MYGKVAQLQYSLKEFFFVYCFERNISTKFYENLLQRGKFSMQNFLFPVLCCFGTLQTCVWGTVVTWKTVKCFQEYILSMIHPKKLLYCKLYCTTFLNLMFMGVQYCRPQAVQRAIELYSVKFHRFYKCAVKRQSENFWWSTNAKQNNSKSKKKQQQQQCLCTHSTEH